MVSNNRPEAQQTRTEPNTRTATTRRGALRALGVGGSTLLGGRILSGRARAETWPKTQSGGLTTSSWGIKRAMGWEVAKSEPQPLNNSPDYIQTIELGIASGAIEESSGNDVYNLLKQGFKIRHQEGDRIQVDSDESHYGSYRYFDSNTGNLDLSAAKYAVSGAMAYADPRIALAYTAGQALYDAYVWYSEKNDTTDSKYRGWDYRYTVPNQTGAKDSTVYMKFFVFGDPGETISFDVLPQASFDAGFLEETVTVTTTMPY